MKIFLEFIALLMSMGAPIHWAINDFKKNILAILFFIIYGSYVVWPLILIHEFSLNHYLDIQVDAYIQFGLAVDIVFMGLFLIVYELCRKNLKIVNAPQRNINNELIHKFVLVVYGIFFTLIFLNNYFGGIDLIAKWLGYTNQMTYGVKGLTYYLQNLVDCLVILILLGYASNMRRMYLIIMLAGAIFFIIPFGFRYRIIYLILGFSILFIYKNQLSIKKILAFTTAILCLTLIFLFLGANRTVIVGQDLNSKYTLQLLDVKKVVIQTRGSYVDLAIYKGIDNGDISHDQGKSFFYYLVVRAIPARFFEGGKKPYPPILMNDVDKVLNLHSPPDCPGCRTGEAQTIMGAVYYSFGLWGIGLVAVILAYLLAFYAKLQSTYVSQLWGITFLLALFMFVTRGYFPQVVDNWFYIVLPLVLLWTYTFFRDRNVRA